MPADHDPEPSSFWLDIQSGKIVKHVYRNLSNIGDDVFRNVLCPRPIDIPAHRYSRCDGSERVEHCGTAQIACVQNQMRSAQRV